MWYRSLGGAFVLLAVGGLLIAEETRGTITKVDGSSITVKSGGFKKDAEAKETTFKVSSETKIIRKGGKDKEDVKLTVDDLKTASKVTNVFVTVVHEGDSVSEIRTGGFGGGFGKKKKTDDK